MLRSTLRFLAGAAVAFALWWYATPAYNELLSAAARFAFRSEPRIARARIEARDRAIAVKSGSDAPSIEVPADQLTYNIVLFAGLVAAVPPRRLWRAFAGLGVLLAFHVVALIVAIEATYATHAGAWSTEHYSSIGQDLWHSADFAYRLGGMFAVAFICWYAATWVPAREQRPGSSRKSRRG